LTLPRTILYISFKIGSGGYSLASYWVTLFLISHLSM